MTPTKSIISQVEKLCDVRVMPLATLTEVATKDKTITVVDTVRNIPYRVDISFIEPGVCVITECQPIHNVLKG